MPDRHKILIVDDEENIRFPFSVILQNAGYDVISAEYITDAKIILENNSFDVAIIDRLLLPDNGMDLVKHIDETRQYKLLTPDDGMNLVKYINETQPFCVNILMSAFPSFESASEGFTNNLFAYIQKPIKKTTLLDSVKNALKRNKKLIELAALEKQIA